MRLRSECWEGHKRTLKPLSLSQSVAFPLLGSPSCWNMMMPWGVFVEKIRISYLQYTSILSHQGHLHPMEQLMRHKSRHSLKWQTFKVTSAPIFLVSSQVQRCVHQCQKLNKPDILCIFWWRSTPSQYTTYTTASGSVSYWAIYATGTGGCTCFWCATVQ